MPRPTLLRVSFCFIVLLVALLFLNEVPAIIRQARTGAVLQGDITSLQPHSSTSRAYSTFAYRYDGKRYEGIARGVSGYSLPGTVEVTVNPQRPSDYWVGNARAELAYVLVTSLVQALFGAAGIAVLMWWQRKAA